VLAVGAGARAEVMKGKLQAGIVFQTSFTDVGSTPSTNFSAIRRW
jgi:hypothetical protein